MNNITLSFSHISLELKTPSYPYTTTVHNGIRYTKTPENVLKGFDHGTSYRECAIDEWILHPDIQVQLENLIVLAKGRPMTLTLPEKSCFYPFGPDMGDSGTFSIVIREHAPSGLRLSPWRTFTNSFVLTAQALPTPVIPPIKHEGSVQVNLIQGIRAPQVELEVQTDPGLSIQVTRSGRCDTVVTGGREMTTGITFDLGKNNAARLLNHLTTDVRATDFVIFVPLGTYLFGARHSSDGAYTVTADLSNIVLEHSKYNRFKLPLTLHLKRDS